MPARPVDRAPGPTKFNSFRHHVMFVYVRSAVTGEERQLTQEIDITQD